MRAIFLLAGVAVLPLVGQMTSEQKRSNLDSFEKVWTTVRDKHWETKPAGLDWQAIHEEYRPRAERAATIEAARAVMQEMLARLHQTHFGIVPGTVYSVVGEEGGGEAVTGIDLRVLDGQVTVTAVDSNSGAEQAGVGPGWQILSIGGIELKPVVEQAMADPAIHELQLTRGLLARLSGSAGTTVRATFLDALNKPVPLELRLATPPGELSRFGNLPPMRVQYESKRIGGAAYVRFNMFMDLPRVMAGFQSTVENCKDCSGLIVDLRGNPGGIAGMAMGMAGFLVGKPNSRLGTMYMRDTTLNFVVNPRAEVFGGPVAILMDACSASTSEIFAEGLKDLGRARIFGTRSAAAALPSAFERLPNGDGFQYAMANYVSQGGKPLEGIGVTPDNEIKLTRTGLLAGHDAVLDAALDWVKKQRTP